MSASVSPHRISPDHPIRELFYSLVERALQSELGIRDVSLARYLGNVLVEFSHQDAIYGLRDLAGKPLEEVAEMLLQGDVTLNATSFDREREVHKHIGDFTLFWTGVYPEMLKHLRSTQRADHLIDYVQQGRQSYRIASTFQLGTYAEEAPVLRQLSEQFESCVYGLHLVRRELDAYGSPEMHRFRRLLQA